MPTAAAFVNFDFENFVITHRTQGKGIDCATLRVSFVSAEVSGVGDERRWFDFPLPFGYQSSISVEKAMARCASKAVSRSTKEARILV